MKAQSMSQLPAHRKYSAYRPASKPLGSEVIEFCSMILAGPHQSRITTKSDTNST